MAKFKTPTTPPVHPALMKEITCCEKCLGKEKVFVSKGGKLRPVYLPRCKNVLCGCHVVEACDQITGKQFDRFAEKVMLVDNPPTLVKTKDGWEDDREGDLVSNCCATDFDPFGYEKEEGIWQERCLNCGKLCEPLYMSNRDIENIKRCRELNVTNTQESQPK